MTRVIAAIVVIAAGVTAWRYYDVAYAPLRQYKQFAEEIVHRRCDAAAAMGTITLHAVQTLFFNPPGVESGVRPAMFAKLSQIASLRKTAAGWRVTSFDNKFVSMDSVK